jgi:hypothetical protein
VPREITSGDELLAEMAAEADKIGLEYGKNPNSLSEPVDAVDALIEFVAPEEAERVPQHHQEPEWLPTHDYTEIDSELDDEETLQAAADTLDFYINDERHNPHAPDFEYQFRAFLHNNDYSYSAATIRHLIASVLGID